LKEFGTTRNLALDHLVERLSSNTISLIIARASTVEGNWRDVIFGDLIQEWLDISQKARKAISRTTFGSGNDMNFQPAAFDKLEEYSGRFMWSIFELGKNTSKVSGGILTGMRSWKLTLDDCSGYTVTYPTIHSDRLL